MSGDYYSEYITSRRPHGRTRGLVSRWHSRMFNRAMRDARFTRKIRVLEIGAGHGQFAEYVTSMGHEYNFVDLSPAVARDMHAKGFVGVCADVEDAPESMNEFDIVWLSHVLEHCETPSQATSLIRNAAKRCSRAGFIVVVSPDATSFKWEFFASDWSHGYPTFRRNVAQIMNEVGLNLYKSRFHRGGRFFWLTRAPFAVLAKVPTFAVDVLLSRRRVAAGEGYFYSWKTLLGWRQIYIMAAKS